MEIPAFIVIIGTEQLWPIKPEGQTEQKQK
jgi:hypothetical protein